MAEPRLTIMADDDDLPRTLRREKEAQEREARERLAAERSRQPDQVHPLERGATPAYRAAETDDYGYAATETGTSSGNEVTVTRLEIPFLHLMLFFLKAVFAAIPALILLGVLLWLAGDLLMAYFPQLVKMQIIFKIPN